MKEHNHTASEITLKIDRMWRGIEKFITVMGTVGTVCILVLMVLTTIDVVLRYIFNKPLKGAYEISEILMLSAVFLGMAYTQLYREHVNADLFVNRLSKHANLIIETVMFLPAILFYGLFAWRGAIGFWESFSTGEYRWGLIRIPLWQARLMVPLGAFFLCLTLIKDIVVNLRKLINWKKGAS